MKIIITAALIMLSLSTAFCADEQVNLTAEELAWIKAHPVVRLAPDPYFAPLEFLEDGEYKGISADYLGLIAERTGLNIEVLQTDDWSQTLQLLKTRGADMNGACTSTVPRSEYLLFTEPVFESEVMIFGTIENSHRIEREELIGRKVGVIADYAEEEFLSLVLPELEPVRFKNFESAMTALSLGQIEYLIGDLAFIGYQKKNLGLTNIIVTGTLGYYHRLGFAVRSDWPELRDILQKGFDSLSADEKDIITDRWIGLQLSDSYISRAVIKYFIYSTVFVLAVLAAVIIWNRTLSSRVVRKTAELNDELIGKEKLLHEVHHRVNNNMQMVMGLLSMGFSEPVTSRIGVLALVQEKGHSDVNIDRIDMRELVYEIVDGLEKEYACSLEEDIELGAGSFTCGIKTAVALGLMLNEIIINLIRAGVLPGNACSLSVVRTDGNRNRIVLALSSGVDDLSVLEGKNGSPSERLILCMKKDLHAESRLTSGVYELTLPKPGEPKA